MSIISHHFVQCYILQGMFTKWRDIQGGAWHKNEVLKWSMIKGHCHSRLWIKWVDEENIPFQIFEIGKVVVKGERQINGSKSR